MGRDIPGAVLALAIWVLGSFFLRGFSASSGAGRVDLRPAGRADRGADLAVLLAIAVLIGAALNAAMRAMWPVEERLSFRARLLGWLRGEVVRRREASHERPLTPMPDPSSTAVRKNPPAPPTPAHRGSHEAPEAALDDRQEKSARTTDERSWSA